MLIATFVCFSAARFIPCVPGRTYFPADLTIPAAIMLRSNQSARSTRILRIVLRFVACQGLVFVSEKARTGNGARGFTGSPVFVASLS